MGWAIVNRVPEVKMKPSLQRREEGMTDMGEDDGRPEDDPENWCRCLSALTLWTVRGKRSPW